MTQDSEVGKKLCKAVRILKRKLNMIALCLKTITTGGFQSGPKYHPDDECNYWRMTKKNQRYPLHQGKEPGQATSRQCGIEQKIIAARMIVQA